MALSRPLSHHATYHNELRNVKMTKMWLGCRRHGGGRTVNRSQFKEFARTVHAGDGERRRVFPSPPIRSMKGACKTTRSRSARRLRFATIGAGMAGILSAIELAEAGHDDFVIDEKADRRRLACTIW
jgi:hypothetical protein